MVNCVYMYGAWKPIYYNGISYVRLDKIMDSEISAK